MGKRIVKYLAIGICWGCTCFVFVHIMGYLMKGKSFLRYVEEDYIGQALGSIVVGVCCATSAIVYTIERLQRWQQVSIHFVVGLSGFFTISYKLKWMPIKSVWHIISYVIVGVLVFFVIWLCFYGYNRHEAKRLNARIKELNKKER